MTRVGIMRALLGFLIVAVPCGAPGAQEPSSLPALDGPLRESRTSYPFSAAAHQSRPLDLGSLGYMEEEYLISGRARVYDWPANGSPVVLAEGPYTTRLLIRRPARANRFSGTVIVEPMNPSVDVDLPIMWAHSYEHFIANGDAWVGITIKPNTVRALKAFDPGRYASLSMPNPRTQASCAAGSINPVSQPTTVSDETGIAWDILTQVGLLLKSEAGSRVLGRTASRLYMTGQSQSAGYARTYATVFARTAKNSGDNPLYDGFLYSGSPPWQVPLHQCLPDLPAGDPRLITGPAGVPVIELFAEGDIGTNIPTRRRDSDAPPDLFRRYEVAGAAHSDPWEFLSFAADSDANRAGGRIHNVGPDPCRPGDVEQSDFPVRYVFNAAWQHLDEWVRRGVAPPRAPPLEVKAGASSLPPDQAFLRDEHGNARDGVRSTYVDVPLAQWVGAKAGPFRCMFVGYKIPFSRAERLRLYESRERYVKKVRERSAELVGARWLTKPDREKIVREAERTPWP
jgi:hypothetical protein